MTLKLALFVVVAAGLVALAESHSYGANESKKTTIGRRSPATAQPVGGSVESMHGGAYRGSGGPSTRFVKEHGGYDPGARPTGVVHAGPDNAVDAVPISWSPGHASQPCVLISPKRSGGISEMASCGKWGVRGNRSQFVRAIDTPVASRAFLSQLAH